MNFFQSMTLFIIFLISRSFEVNYLKLFWDVIMDCYKITLNQIMGYSPWLRCGFILMLPSKTLIGCGWRLSNQLESNWNHFLKSVKWYFFNIFWWRTGFTPWCYSNNDHCQLLQILKIRYGTKQLYNTIWFGF